MNRPAARWLAVVVALALSAARPARAAEELDWSAWQRLPMFDGGRLMPLDTFARQSASTVCRRESPTLSLEGAVLGPDGQAADPASAAELAAARQLFPDGRPRTFLAAELLLSWMVEPEKWDYVPFLPADGEAIRRLLAPPDQVRRQLAAGAAGSRAGEGGPAIGLPLLGRHGEKLKYASPHQVRQSMLLVEKLREMQAAADGGQNAPLVGLDKQVRELFEALKLFGYLSFDPRGSAEGRGRFEEALNTAVRTWNDVAQQLQQAPHDAAGEARAEDARRAAAGLVEAAGARPQGLKNVQPAAVRFQKATAALADYYATLARQADAAQPGVQGTSDERLRLAALVQKTADLARAAADTHQALYETGRALRLVPALDPAALSQRRDVQDNVPPWLDMPAMLFGSAELLREYPQAELTAVRASFDKLKAAYLDRGNPQRPEHFAAATQALAAAVRALGQAIEPLRQKLAIPDPDAATIAATAYPRPGATDVELLYNRVNPFFYSWIINLAAGTLLLLAFGIARRPLFWLGIVVLAAGQVTALFGFALRGLITGWVPIASMFETMAYVGVVVGFLGLWFTLLPLFWPGLKRAWALTALPAWRRAAPDADVISPRGPFAPDPSPGTDRRLVRGAGSTNSAAVVPVAVLRVVLSAGLFWFLTMVPYGGSGQRGYFSLTPRMAAGALLPTFQNLLTWLVGLAVLAPAVWLLPRALLTALMAPLTVLSSGTTAAGRRRMLEQVYQRKPFAVTGAIMGFVAACIGFHSPIWQNQIGSMTVVLRDNFWLTIHVLTITESYAAGILALGLGNIALGWYLFGRYRPATVAERTWEGHRPAHGYQALPTALHRRPPEQCAVLGGYIYRAMQVAVVLLAAGTIFGALWADVSWGRFWGWDPKEVFALTSLLVYLAVLHGRFAGWLGNYGLAAGSICGATAIVGAWYGVNFVFKSGLHAYATGAGQWQWVAAGLGADWLFAMAAGLRYWLETRRGGPALPPSTRPPGDATDFAAREPRTEPVGSAEVSHG